MSRTFALDTIEHRNSFLVLQTILPPLISGQKDVLVLNYFWDNLSFLATRVSTSWWRLSRSWVHRREKKLVPWILIILNSSFHKSKDVSGKRYFGTRRQRMPWTLLHRRWRILQNGESNRWRDVHIHSLMNCDKNQRVFLLENRCRPCLILRNMN